MVGEHDGRVGVNLSASTFEQPVDANGERAQVAGDNNARSASARRDPKRRSRMLVGDDLPEGFVPV